MKKQTNSRMKYRKPLYYKKSKAAKEDEEYDEFLENEDLPQQKQYKHLPSRIKKNSRYNREYEYTDYDDEYEGNIEDLSQPFYKQDSYKHSPSRIKSSRYNREYEYTDYTDDHEGHQYIYDYEKEMYDSGDEMSDYTTEDTSKFGRQPGKPRQYHSRTETEDFDDSDSNCLSCTSRRGQRSDYTSEYPSEYQREHIPAPRYRNMHRHNIVKRRLIPSETENERSPYHKKIKNRSGNKNYYHKEYEKEFDYRESPDRSNFETSNRGNPYHSTPQKVYVAKAPDGHKVFIKQQRGLKEQTFESRSGIDLNFYKEGLVEEIEHPEWSKNKPRYQVFAANTGENQGAFQKQLKQNPKETLLSVTEYNSSVPLAALKNTNSTKGADKSQSIVYLPVVVMDNDIKLPHSKVVHAETLLQTVRDKAEKPLETNNMDIYLENEDGKDNIFQQAKRTGVQGTTTPKNIQVYNAQSTRSNKPYVISKVASMIKIKPESKSDYPVQKSYINVAPSKTKPVERKGSKISLRSGGSKISQQLPVVGMNKTKSATGSVYSAQVQKKEIKSKNDKKIKSKISSEGSKSELLLSVINPSSMDSQLSEPKTNTVTSTKGDKQDQKDIQQSPSGFSLKNDFPTKRARSKSFIKQTTIDRRVPRCKKPTLDGSVISESNVRNVPSKQSILERQCSVENESKIITLKEVNNGKYEESTNVFDQSEADMQPKTNQTQAALPQKGFGSSIFHKKRSKIKLDQSKSIIPKSDLYNFNPDEYTSPNTSHVAIQRNKSKEDIHRPKKSSSTKKLQTHRSNKQEFRIWKILSLNSNAFRYIYRAVQYFLGLSIHGTLMEILRNAKQSD